MATVQKFPEGVSNEKSEFLLAEPSDSASRLAFISIHSTIELYNAAVPPQKKSSATIFFGTAASCINSTMKSR